MPQAQKMNDNDQQSPSNHPKTMKSLLSETEQTAIRSLLSDAEDAPAVNQCEELNTIFTVISHPARRYILTYLLRVEGYVTMAEVVDYVIDATESDSDTQELRREVTVSLTHTHLPMLEEEGYIRYNMERQLIHQTPKTRTTAPYLKVALLHCEREQSES